MFKQSVIKIGIVLLTVGALLTGCTTVQSQENDADTATYKESTVTKGNITVGISETATATISAVTHGFDVEGEIAEIYVKAGQTVKQGDPIAKISVEDLQAEIAKLELSYTQAQVNLEQAKITQQLTAIEAQYEYTTNKNLETTAPLTYDQTLDQLGYDLEDILDQIDEADEKYDEYDEKTEKSGYYTEYNIASLLSDVNSCKAEVTRLETAIKEANAAQTPDADAIALLETELAAAQKSLSAAQSAYNTNYEKYESAVDKAETEMESLKKTITSLKNQYSQLSGTVDATKLEAEYQLDESLEKSKNADTLYQIELSQVANNIKSQELALEETALEIAELKSSAGEQVIKASCDGTVMSVDSKVGATVTKDATIATIANSSEVYVMTSIAQEDISEITLGKTAEITFEAYPEQTFTGVVDSITTTPARTSSSTVSYQVNVLISTDGSQIYEGMTGSVTFVSKQVQDVLCVSNRAVTTENGKQYVKVKAADGTLTQTEITTGFSDGRNCEVTSGLSEGDVVVIESVVNQQ